MDKKEIRHIDRREVESYKEECFPGIWRSWKCEIEIQPNGRLFNNWLFWFTLPLEDEDENEELVGAEIYITYGHGQHVEVAEVVYNKMGDKIGSRSLTTTMDNLNKMVEHSEKIMKQFEEKYGL